MTNADKYLKDDVSIEELITTMENELPLSYVDVAQFWKKTIKPTLTEDERVILSKVKSDYKYIGRKKFLGAEFLYVSCNKKCDDFIALTPFEHLFQFIKERRRISNSRTIRR